jgi:Fe-S cluster assembly ATPase SufC
MDFLELVKDRMKLVEMPEELLYRSVNEGFSGGEKKRNEILQMAVLEPRLAILDETDSGLDIDALHVVARGVNVLRSPERAIILVTHYQRLLNHRAGSGTCSWTAYAKSGDKTPARTREARLRLDCPGRRAGNHLKQRFI